MQFFFLIRFIEQEVCFKDSHVREYKKIIDSEVVTISLSYVAKLNCNTKHFGHSKNVSGGWIGGIQQIRSVKITIQNLKFSRKIKLSYEPANFRQPYCKGLWQIVLPHANKYFARKKKLLQWQYIAIRVHCTSGAASCEDIITILPFSQISFVPVHVTNCKIEGSFSMALVCSSSVKHMNKIQIRSVIFT